MNKEIKVKPAKPVGVPVFPPMDKKVAWDELPELGQIILDRGDYSYGYDPYKLSLPMDKLAEEESNLIRIDLDKAAKELAKLEVGGDSFSENHDEYFIAYDKYYDILFKSKS